MDLLDENRPLVKRGLELLNTRPVRGIRELIDVMELSEKKISAYHVGFMLGPCINASGRMDTAEKALRLLLTEDADEAMRIAGELRGLNEERKKMTERAAEEAYALIEKEYAQDKVYVVYLPDCHESIAGIVAGRVKEKYGHPALIVTDAEEVDAMYDDIGAELEIKNLRRTQAELFEELTLFYRVVFLGEKIDL